MQGVFTTTVAQGETENPNLRMQARDLPGDGTFHASCVKSTLAFFWLYWLVRGKPWT